MTDPLALLPLALAAGGGRVDQYETQQLVAAGLTLLQRCAPLVRALQGRRAAVLLPTSPAFVTALAACVPDGTTTGLLDGARRRARVLAGGRSTDVDLGAHFGLALEGEADPHGRDEEAAIVYTSAMAGRALGA